MIDKSGRVVWAGRYDAFGNIQIEVAEIENNLRFPGQYYDAETGLYYNWHRYYDPVVGRYLSADPIKEGMNLYTYVENNSLNWKDPFGLCKKEEYYIPNLGPHQEVPVFKDINEKELFKNLNGAGNIEAKINWLEYFVGVHGNWWGPFTSGGIWIFPGGIGDVNVPPKDKYDALAKWHDINRWLSANFPVGTTVYIKIQDRWVPFNVKRSQELDFIAIGSYIIMSTNPAFALF
jgi:RHS repeat-associated protein